MEASCPILRIRSPIALMFAKICACIRGLPANRAVLKEGCNLSRAVNATLNPLTS
jgi:hypothetical protein